MYDVLFDKGTPQWIDRLFDELIQEITIDLSEQSHVYEKIKQELQVLYEEYPDLVAFIENDDIHEIVLADNVAKALGRLIFLEFEIMEMYQKMMYFRGCRDGYVFSKYLGIKGEE